MSDRAEFRPSGRLRAGTPATPRALPAGTSLVTGMVSPTTPFVEPLTGILTTISYRFLYNLLSPVSATTATIALLQNADDALGAQIAAVQGDVVAAQTDIATLQGDVAQLQADMAQAQSDIAALDGRVSAIEGRLAAAGIP